MQTAKRLDGSIIFESKGAPWCFGGPTQLAYSAYREDQLWMRCIENFSHCITQSYQSLHKLILVKIHLPRKVYLSTHPSICWEHALQSNWRLRVVSLWCGGLIWIQLPLGKTKRCGPFGPPGVILSTHIQTATKRWDLKPSNWRLSCFKQVLACTDMTGCVCMHVVNLGTVGVTVSTDVWNLSISSWLNPKSLP